MECPVFISVCPSKYDIVYRGSDAVDSLDGGVFFLFVVILGIQTLVKLFSGHALEGFTTVIIVILISSSIMMFGIGMIGIYLAKIYDEVQGRPRYIISEVRKKSGSSDQWEPKE